MLSEDLPPLPLAEIGRYRRLQKARERGLVVAAMDLPHWIVREGRTYVLFVEEQARERAVAAVAEFEAEERERPSVPEPEPMEIPLVAVAGTLGAMAFFFWLQSVTPGAVARGSADDSLILAGKWPRIFTALTLHGDSEHLISNVSLGAFAFAFVFARFGVGAGLLGTVLGGGLGNLLNAVAHMNGPHSSIGSSTALFASLGLLAGAEIAARLMHRATRSAWQLLVPVGAGLAFLALFGGGGANPDGSPVNDAGRVDVMAHLFGLAAGVVLGAVMFAAGLKMGASRMTQILCGAGAVTLLVAAWALAWRS